MKHQYKSCSNSEGSPITHPRLLQTACWRCYQGILGRLDSVRAGVEREFGRGTAEYPHMLKSALNEAEALAWQTPYPHLFFPALAEEKAAAAQRWAARQHELLAREQVLAFAA